MIDKLTTEKSTTINRMNLISYHNLFVMYLFCSTEGSISCGLRINVLSNIRLSLLSNLNFKNYCNSFKTILIEMRKMHDDLKFLSQLNLQIKHGNNAALLNQFIKCTGKWQWL